LTFQRAFVTRQEKHPLQEEQTAMVDGFMQAGTGLAMLKVAAKTIDCRF
jgi:hypothetical protein